MMKTEWRGFKGNMWQSEVNLRDFIQNVPCRTNSGN